MAGLQWLDICGEGLRTVIASSMLCAVELQANGWISSRGGDWAEVVEASSI